MFTGIVECIGIVSKIESDKDCKRLEIIPPKNFNTKLNKGASISVNGVCLTSLDKGLKKLKFDIVEETLSRTNLNNI
jgi:Riboflavin synthase alpha chain